MSAITLTSLRKTYGPIVAVDDLTCEIRAGETFGLLGPNGAGKSTTILMAAGAVVPDAGSIAVNGGGSPSDPAVRRSLGIAPQSLSLYDELSAESNVAFFGRMHGLSGRELRERTRKALDFVGLTDRRGDRAGGFSGGMKRRLNLACALVHDPAIVILDEPTAGVDPQSRHHIFERIEDLKDRGRTIVYTTHYMEEAQRLCDRVAIVDHGRLLALDTVDRLIQQHGGDAVVSATLDGPVPAGADLPAPPEGDMLRFRSRQPLQDLARLASSNLRFRELNVARPSLEDVFLNLTGRRLRD